MIVLAENERMQLLSLWVGAVVFAAILYLTASFSKANLLGIFVLGSCLAKACVLSVRARKIATVAE